MLQGVEVLTEKELLDRKRQKILSQKQNSKLFHLSQWISNRYNYYAKLLTEGFKYVIASTFVCFCIPLPLCGLAHESYYFRTSATTDELIRRSSLFLICSTSSISHRESCVPITWLFSALLFSIISFVLSALPLFLDA